MTRRSLLARSRGFTLVELLIVILMMGIVTMAVYSLYESTQRTATTQDEVVEVQQNLRVAMEQIARDIRMAGFMVPSADTPLAAAGQNSLTLRTASANGRAARVDDNPAITVANGASADFDLDVASSDRAALFRDDDVVRIIRPPNQNDLFPGCLIQLRNDPSTGSDTLPLRITNNSGAAISDLQIRPGDIVARVANNSDNPNTVRYFRENDLLRRRADEGTAAVDTQSVATSLLQSGDPNLDGLRFSYILDDGTEQATVTGSALDDVKAVRVTLTGVATTPQGTKERRLTNIVALRNR